MSRNRELKQLVDALTSFGKSASRQEEELQHVTAERDALLAELANVNGRLVEMESQLAASIKASESMRHAMEMAEDESRRWHEQCNALLQALHAYSTSPPKPATSRAPSSRQHRPQPYPLDDHTPRAHAHPLPRSTTSHAAVSATKVESDTELAESTLRATTTNRPASTSTLVGDYGDPRRHGFAQPDTSRRSTTKTSRSRKYQAEEEDKSEEDEMDDLYEESEDELNALEPTPNAPRLKQTPRRPNPGQSSRAESHHASNKKRKLAPGPSAGKKVKR